MTWRRPLPESGWTIASRALNGMPMPLHGSNASSGRSYTAPQRSTPQKAKVYQIKIEIGVPRRKPIVVTHDRIGSRAHEELGLAIRDAFEVAMRKVDGMAAKIGQRSKLDRGRRKPRPAEHTA